MAIRTFLLGLVLAVSTAAVSGREETITLAYSLDNYDLSPIFAAFTQETGVKISYAQLSTSDMKTEIILRADARSLPDAVIVPGDLLGLSVAQFGEVPDDWLSTELTPKTRQHGRVKDIQRGVPIIAGNHLLLYYNKNMVQKPASDWGTLIDLHLQQSGATRVISWSYNEMFWLIPFLGAYEAFPYANNRIALNALGIGEAFQYYKQLSESGFVDAKCNYQCAFDAFVNERVAYTINGSWSLGGFKDQLGDKLGVTLLPGIDNKKLRPYSSVHALAFPNNASHSNKQEALKKLSLFFQSYQIQNRIWEDISGLPVNEKALQNIKADADANTKNLLMQLEQSEPMPNDPEMAIVWEALLMGFNRYQGGALQVDEALAYMQYVAEKSWNEQQ